MTHIEYLFSLERHGIKLGLQNIRCLLEESGNPQELFPTVHIAGTNGKGSVAAIVAAIVRAAGYKVGRFTSPHLMDLRERFIVDAALIPSEALDQQIAWFRAIAERMNPPPTFFEMNTAIAFRWFAQSKVDLAVVEVGMGGRLDSTNVVHPLAAAITTIDIEHTKYLGDTIEKIAAEKAGIIKPGVTVVLGETKPAPLEVMLKRARELDAPCRIIDRDFVFDLSGTPFNHTIQYRGHALEVGPTPLTLAGAYQGQNAATALALIECIQPHFPKIDQQAIVAGLANVQWPGRLEKIMDNPSVVIDVAHNPAGARAVASQLLPGLTLLAVSADKDVKTIIDILAPVTTTFIFSQFSGTRALPVDALCEAGQAYPYRKTSNLHEAIRLAFDLLGNTGSLLITGSIFTAGEARRILVDGYGAQPLLF